MHWTHPDAVTLAQLVFFVLIFPTYLYHLFTQGSRLRRTWYFFSVFAVVKIVGDALLIANMVQENNGNPPSEGLLTPGSILTSISMAPLFFGMRNLLTKARRPDMEHKRRPPIMIVLIVAGAAFSIAGYLEYILNRNFSLGCILVKVSAFVFLAAALVLLFHGIDHLRKTPSVYVESYKVYVYALLLAMPFILVRIVYFILSAFALETSGDLTHYSKFSILNGSWSARLGMLVIMEMCVALVYSVAGFLFHARSKYGYSTGDRVEMAEPKYF